jgi:hypothetical protein
MADHLDALNDFSKSVADRLFEAYLSWRAHARGERESDSDGGVLLSFAKITILTIVTNG